MKKFYSLALIAAACTLSVSAKDLKAVPAFAKATPVTNITEAKAEMSLSTLAAGKTVAVSNRAESNLDGYQLICTGYLPGKTQNYDFEDPCSFSAAAEADTYVINGFYSSLFGQSNPMTVNLTQEVISGTTYEVLSFPAGQVLATEEGADYVLCAIGRNTSTGKYSYDPNGTIDFAKLYDEEAGLYFWIPLFSFGDAYESGIAFIDLATTSFYPVLEPQFVEPNCTITATCMTYTSQNGQTVVDETYPVNSCGMADTFKRLGKNYLQIPGLPYSTFWIGDYINLEVALDGSAVSTGAICASFYTDASHTDTFDAYYWTPAEGNDVLPVTLNATVSENTETNKTTVTFDFDTIYLGAPADEDPTKCGWMGIEWANPTYVINKTFGLTAGVEKVEADAEFDENAPVEYFNLQGQRIANPEAGQLVIKKQGAKAAKVVIR